MRTIIAAAVFITISFIWHSHGSEEKTSAIVVFDGSNTVLTIANFTRIQKFILDHGKRLTYCNMFSNNPYWSFPEFNAYLNPSDQRNMKCDIAKSELNILVIQITEPGPTKYLQIVMNKTKKELRVEDLYSKTDTRILIKAAIEYFQKALTEIDKQTKQ